MPACPPRAVRTDLANAGWRRMMKALLFALAVAAVAHGFCFSSLPYYAASKALAIAFGDVTSHAACRFSNASGTNFDNDCPPVCAGFVRATWGDCYCLNPGYVPATGDAPFNTFSTSGLFQFMAKSSPLATTMQCRSWMNTPSSVAMWSCASGRPQQHHDTHEMVLRDSDVAPSVRVERRLKPVRIA